MRVAFWHSTKPRERLLSDAFLAGVRLHGDEVSTHYLPSDPETIEIPPDSSEVACMVGVKSGHLYRAHLRAGMRIVYIDKGYVRSREDNQEGWKYWRVSIGGHHPTKYIADAAYPSDRWEALGLGVLPWRTPDAGLHIVLAGSSEKYHQFYGLKHPTNYARKLVGKIREVSERKIIYRPKPSWRAAERIDGTEFSVGGSINDVLKDAHALVTHGSNACFEAMLMGVPSIIMGDAVARPISSTSVEVVEDPLLATDEERLRILQNLAYFQWTLREMAEGRAWSVLRPLVFGL